jgi:hypothetical protein
LRFGLVFKERVIVEKGLVFSGFGSHKQNFGRESELGNVVDRLALLSQ